MVMVVPRRIAVVALLLCVVLTWKQARVWSTEVSIWERAVLVSPRKPGPHLALGRAYQHALRFEDAAREYAEVLRRTKGFQEGGFYRMAVGINTAKLFAQQNRIDDAIDLLDRLTETFPEEADTLHAVQSALLIDAGATCRQLQLMQLQCGL